MSARNFNTGFRGSGQTFYVCPTWQACMASDLMWAAVTEQGWTCSCGKPMNIPISVDTARREWREWTKPSPR